nr:hypothetical protein Q903MT_gene6509 [Picea sitchensis]
MKIHCRNNLGSGSAFLYDSTSLITERGCSALKGGFYDNTLLSVGVYIPGQVHGGLEGWDHQKEC